MSFKIIDDNSEIVELAQEEVITEEVITEEVEGDVITEGEASKWNDEEVLEYIKSNPELSDKLTTRVEVQTEIPDDVKKYLEFKKETGRGYQDFLETQKDFSQENDESLVKKLIQSKNPEFSQEEINDEFTDIYGFDEDFDDEREVKKKKREYKKAISESIEYLNTMKEKYSTPLGSNESAVPQEYIDAKNNLESIRQEETSYNESNKQQVDYFLSETDKVFSEDFKGFDFKVGEETISHKISNPTEIKNFQSDVSNFFQKFLDDKGMVKNAEEYHKAIYIAMNYESVIKNIYETAKAKTIEDEVRSSKNIDMGIRSTPQELKSGFTMKIIS